MLGKYIRTKQYRCVRYGRNSLLNTGEVRYKLDTGTRNFGKFDIYELDTGTPGTGIPSTEILGVRVFVRYNFNTLPNTPVWFGTESIPVPDTLVSSVRPPKYIPDTGIPSTTIRGLSVFVRYGLGTEVSDIQWRDTDVL